MKNYGFFLSDKLITTWKNNSNKNNKKKKTQVKRRWLNSIITDIGKVMRVWKQGQSHILWQTTVWKTPSINAFDTRNIFPTFCLVDTGRSYIHGVINNYKTIIKIL